MDINMYIKVSLNENYGAHRKSSPFPFVANHYFLTYISQASSQGKQKYHLN